jgi:hypothetical protein
MQGRSRSEIYRDFIEFVQSECQREQSFVNRRMFSVFLWCFLLPVVVSVTVLLLAKFHIVPMRIRSYLDWLILIFPVSYSIYFLSFEVLRSAPQKLRGGGVVSALGDSLKEAKWRDETTLAMVKGVRATPEDWSWIISNFKIDLERMQNRTRQLTILAGAVLFLIMQGIDSISSEEPSVTWIKNPIVGWMELEATHMSEFVGLGLFLVLLYLSGSQTYYTLQRYLGCAQLVQRETDTERFSSGRRLSSS